MCNGVNKSCPAQEPKPVGTPCASQDMGKCDRQGRCLSLCQQMDLTHVPCLCQSADEACMQCCQPPGGQCTPIHRLHQNLEAQFLSNGRACRQGTCLNVRDLIKN